MPVLSKKLFNSKKIEQVITKQNGWYAKEDFSLLLKREKERTSRNSSPIAFIKLFVKTQQNQPSKTNRKDYFDFFSELIILVTQNTRFADIKSITTDHYISVLLVDTSMDEAKTFMEKMSASLLAFFNEQGREKFSGIIKSISISSYPTTIIQDGIHLHGSPVTTNNFVFIPQKNHTRKTFQDKISPAYGSLGRGTSNTLLIDWKLRTTSPELFQKNASFHANTSFKQHYHFTYPYFKRCLDIIGSVIGIVFLLPIIILISILIKLSSKGPVLFKQTRIGYQGKPFTMLKFRTMQTGNNDEIHRKYVEKLIHGKNKETNQGEPGEQLYKLKQDPRITDFGKFLRRTSLDEIPQFFNILWGNMSLVGPRPPIKYEVEHYQEWHWRRIMEARPGLTGLWQIYGRNKTTFDDMVRLDIEYAQKQSVWLDIKIIFKTFGVIFNPKAGL